MTKLKRIFWVKRFCGFYFLVNIRGKRIKKYETTGCLVDYADIAELIKQEQVQRKVKEK